MTIDEARQALSQRVNGTFRGYCEKTLAGDFAVELETKFAALESQWREQRAEIIKLKAAIRQTLDENGHLADGDNCTLIHLKTAIGYEDEEEI